MRSERPIERTPSTADVAAATAAARTERGRVEPDRDVEVPRNDARADQPASGAVRLLPVEAADELRPKWADIQASFVDEPRRAVEQADELVAEAISRLAEGFASARASLEQEWDRNDDVSTENLRLALQRYRAFFDRLLHI
jgi:hypothetical protein